VSVCRYRKVIAAGSRSITAAAWEEYRHEGANTAAMAWEWLLDVWSELRKTVIFITHDVDEAVFLADRVYVMSARPGEIVDEVAVDLPRPRDPALRMAPDFVALRNRLLERIRSETLKSFAGGQG